jgi:glycerate-2-kinase
MESVKVALMIIKNGLEIGDTALRRQAIKILESGIEAVLPSDILSAAVAYFPGHNMLSINGLFHHIGRRIFVIGGGKASGKMAEALEKILPTSRIVDGLVVCKGGIYNTQKIRVANAGHPVPDDCGESAVKEILSLKDRYKIGSDDTVICLLSGGASSLLPCPAEGISLSDKQMVTKLLMSCGAEIGEVNTVRKHLSRLKGGRLASYFAPAQVVAMIISDVIGNDIATIASGLACPDPTTYDDALSVLDKYAITDKVSESIVWHFQKGVAGEIPETPKTLDNCYNYIVADGRMALESMKKKASALGFNPFIITAEQKGETSAVARQRACEIAAGKYSGYDALIIGGETTPVLPEEHGTGGRSQQYAGVSMLGLKGFGGEWVVAAMGTDGSDFMPDVAGAMVDNRSYRAALEMSADVESYLRNYDSNTLMKIIGGCEIVTGETGTNVGDVMLYLLKQD